MKRARTGLIVASLLFSVSANLVIAPQSVAQDKALRKIFSGWMTDYSTYGDTSRGQIQAMDYVVKGHMLADVPAVLGSMDIVFGEIDR